MNSLQRYRQQKKRKIFYTNVVIITLFLLLAGTYVLRPALFTSSAHTIGSRVWNGAGKVFGVQGDLYAYFTSKGELQRQKEELERKLRDQELRLKQLDVIKAANKDLREMWQSASTTEGIIASVVVAPPQTAYDIVILNIGSIDGAYVGDLVVRSGIVVGEITSVYEQTSVVRLFSTPDVVTRGVVHDIDTSFEFIGRGGGSFVATAPKDTVIDIGATVVFPDDEEYVLAEVVDIVEQPTDPFKLILARSPVNINELSHVLVIK